MALRSLGLSACALFVAVNYAVAGNDLPVVVQQSGDRAQCAGQDASLTVAAAASGLPTTFQWQVEVAGEWHEVRIIPPREGVWARVATWVDAETNSSTLFFAWIGAHDNGNYRCVVSGPFGSTVSEPMRLTALGADFGSAGGMPEPDFAYDNNDFIVYIQAFFEGSLTADLGSAGGVRGGDGRLDNNDFIAFVGLFFDGCVGPL